MSEKQAARFERTCPGASCRVCGQPGLAPVLDLGEMPHSDRLRSAEVLGRPNPRYPLALGFCEGGSLVQLLETVDPEVSFGEDYLYFSSFSDALLEHSRRNAVELLERFGLEPGHRVVEVSSNDG